MASLFLKYSALAQKHRVQLLVASCGSVFAANLFYHVFPDNTYRKLYQAWTKGQPSNLSDKLDNVFQQVLEDYNVSFPGGYSAFASFGFQPVGAGVPWLPAGAQIGIPANFNSTQDDPAGITNRTIFINGKEVEWDSDIGTTLKDALVFSPEAQKFAMAREVARLESGGPVLNAVVAPTCLAGVWIYSVTLKQIFALHTGPAVFRGMVNLVALSLGAVSYYLTTDAFTQWLDYRCDRCAARLSRDYAKGGVEFYDKILIRNKTLRSLMGQKGAEMYSPSGNLFPANLLKLRHAPYTSRRDGIMNLLKEEKA
ncbi:transmembrane protein 177 [Hypomesus transpacificus]|uniref:transmembrane protein 177 n=1 Tax=Hypomesus transpacificus TaxID=137520 RepID=UPI001F0784F6|nr:transmembrane protein 177 [Hypomesus transpacificus]XP_046902818.1 transmembrane protein 177 [Hypomesus transpacificus]XP_046902819.1 transmembrane protein 177 [Hypomesus transpacificus]